jgi:hypothetical protein
MDDDVIVLLRRIEAKQDRPTFNGWRQTITIIVAVCGVSLTSIGSIYSVLSNRIERHESRMSHDGTAGWIERLDERTRSTSRSGRTAR